MIANARNAYLFDDVMLQLSRAGNADYGEIMKQGAKVTYVQEHHDQAIFRIEKGEKAGQWKTKYKEGDKRKNLIRRTQQEIIDFLYDYYQKGEGSNKTFETVYGELLIYKRDTELRSYKTIEDYMCLYNRFMLPIGKIKIGTLTEDMLRKWIVEDVLPTSPRDDAFKRLLIYVNKAFSFARKMQYITGNPMEFIEFRDYRKHCTHVYKPDEDTYFTVEETERIREEMLENRQNPRALIALLDIEMGMRADEPVALHWDDVRNDCISIHRQQIRRDDLTPAVYEEVDYTKDTRCTGGTPRVFPITPRIREILDMAAELPGDSVYIFHDEEGRMVTKDSYMKFLRRHCQRLGLKITNNHAFRKALNNNVFIPAGFSSNERAALLGHTVRTNEQNYSLRRVDRINELGSRMAQVQAEQITNVRYPKVPNSSHNETSPAAAS